MKSGVYDGHADTHKLMDQKYTREDTLHAWYDEPGGVHPFDRTTIPTRKNTTDMAGKYSWATAVRHDEDGRLEAGPLSRQLVAGGKHGESWQHYDPSVLNMYKKMGGASVMLRHFSRMHEGLALYRQAERALREFKLNDPWYIKPTCVHGARTRCQYRRGACAVQNGLIGNIPRPTLVAVDIQAQSGRPVLT